MEDRIKIAVEKYDRDGFVVIEDFLTEHEVRKMKAAIERIIDEMDPKDHPNSIFTTKDPDQHVNDRYFMESVDKIRFFYEQDAFDKTGKLVVDKHQAFNKIGHALHWLDATFKNVSFSSKVAELMKAIGFQSPAIVQSMYIFKHAKIGGSVVPHYDATFLQANPIKNSIGLWFALDDATTQNGCLHFAKGTHEINDASYRFNRTDAQSGKLLEFHGQMPDWSSRSYTPCPAKKGSVVLINSLTWHHSEQNISEHERHAYTLHIIERHNTTWNKENWLQENDTYKFPGIFENIVE